MGRTACPSGEGAGAGCPERPPRFETIEDFPLARVLVTDDDGFAPPHMIDHLVGLQGASGHDLSALIRVARNALFFLSGERHQAARVAVLRVLGTNRLEGWNPTIDQVVNESLTRLARAETPDLVRDFSNPVFQQVCRAVMGVTPEDPEEWDYWASRLQEVLEPLLPLRRVLELQEGFQSMLGQVRGQPRRSTGSGPDSVLSSLSSDPPDGFEQEDIDALVIVLYGASINLAQTLTNIVQDLLERPGAGREAADEDWLALHLEDLIRDNLSPKYIFRIARKTEVVEGRSFVAGDNVMVDLRAVHGDATLRVCAAGEEPDVRGPSQRRAHLAFGFGLHRCVGASLTRVVLRRAIPALFQAFPDLSLTGEAPEVSPHSQAVALDTLACRT